MKTSENLTSQDYQKFLQQIDLNEKEKLLLIYLFEAGKNGLTATQIASFFNYDNFQPANTIIGRLGHKVCDCYQAYNPYRENRMKCWWLFVADGEDSRQGFTWYLAEPLAEAMIAEGMVQRYQAEQKTLYPEIINESLFEGAKRTITVNSYERNPEARKKCIDYYGHQCLVCGFDFEKVYGEVGKEFIHVHHLKEIASIGETYQINPVTDLRPVCPNCHAMLHRKNPAYTIEELQNLIRN